jgi:hypothetical protein
MKARARGRMESGDVSHEKLESDEGDCAQNGADSERRPAYAEAPAPEKGSIRMSCAMHASPL